MAAAVLALAIGDSTRTNAYLQEATNSTVASQMQPYPMEDCVLASGVTRLMEGGLFAMNSPTATVESRIA